MFFRACISDCESDCLFPELCESDCCVRVRSSVLNRCALLGLLIASCCCSESLRFLFSLPVCIEEGGLILHLVAGICSCEFCLPLFRLLAGSSSLSRDHPAPCLTGRPHFIVRDSWLVFISAMVRWRSFLQWRGRWEKVSTARVAIAPCFAAAPPWAAVMIRRPKEACGPFRIRSRDGCVRHAVETMSADMGLRDNIRDPRKIRRAL